jgi:2-hydroxy-3-oxopropionate reductase
MRVVSILLIHNNGDGQTCKVTNQIIVALNLQAVSEALVFASKADTELSTVHDALMSGFANSKILEVHGESVIKRTFDPAFRVELHQKEFEPRTR